MLLKSKDFRDLNQPGCRASPAHMNSPLHLLHHTGCINLDLLHHTGCINLHLLYHTGILLQMLYMLIGYITCYLFLDIPR